jgi:heptosyltransferase-2
MATVFMGLRMLSRSRLRSVKFYDLVLAILSAFVQAIRYRKTISEPPGTILVIKPDHIGDFVLATPILVNLRHWYPEAHIAVLVGPSTAALADGCPLLQEVIVYRSTRFSKVPMFSKQAFENLVQVVRLSRRSFDLVIDLRPTLGTLMMAAMASWRTRLDYAGHRLRRALISPERTGPAAHQVERNLELLSLVGKAFVRRTPIIWYTQDDRGRIESLLAEYGIGQREQVCILHPGAAWEYRRWTPDGFAEIADWLFEESKLRVVLTGGPGDIEVCAKIQQSASADIVNLGGKVAVRELAALFARAKLFVGYDSGPMHIAAACGIPVVALFGPGDHLLFSPYSSKAIVVRESVPCSPCKQVRCIRPDSSCMQMITVERVKGACRWALGGH